MRKSLHLKRETLSALSANELGVVAGGQQQILTHLACNPTDGCGHGASFDAACPTFPVNPCLSLNGCIVTS